ncbi:MAG: four helix bundle protein [Gammaproteobacteria bacterium]|nr:MAG: four helix bundle protein [Gammaproteobacteria bacterium]
MFVRLVYKFEKLEVWKLALDYLERVYEYSGALPEDEKFNLVSQWRRAATSVCLNIAEGSSGGSDKVQRRFLGIALRSLIETVAILKIVEKRKMLPADRLNEMYRDSQTLAKKLYAFKTYLENKDGSFREPEAEYDSNWLIDWHDESE